MVSALIDLESLDLSRNVLSEEKLRSVLPHDHEFRLVDGICYLDAEGTVAVGYKDWDANPWWARGHIPGRPIMPGVLMIEGCAQVATVLVKISPDGWDPERFIGMGGVDGARFRQMVTPPARVYFVAVASRRSSKIAKFKTAAYRGMELAMEMELVGVQL
jgi:3-hydroxyacyl-[acyl-carrier-protein] dehydratase